ncbi:MAG: transporter [Candidatus Thiodiazotropha endolucinida]|nr:transporter [Candidatus Thiodiazotropha taylori]MCG8026934.1 transporter [Candidatus Thiodiazotropha taylori]MCG8042098.1 transporter [Candidatus Thiodiazotropha taylori]MCG8049779.1 transporter [Candidatus Thiodiazotropha taylori]MCG8054265.1 transporter [Candidatus Thiodiazotropha taylori]
MLFQKTKQPHGAQVATILLLSFGSSPVTLLHAAPLNVPKSATTFTVSQIYSSGDYDLDVETEMHATLFKVAYRSRDWGGSLSLPYLDITGPATAIYEDIYTGELYLVDVDDENRSGIGDAVVSLDRTIWQNLRNRQKLSLGAAIKLPTGNEEKNLSSGESDISFFAKGHIRQEKMLFSGQMGYQIMGDTEFTDYNNRLFVAAGLFHMIDRHWGIGGGIRFKQASLDDRDDQLSINTFVSHRLSKPWRLGFRINWGLSDAVADYSLGLQLSYTRR